MADRIIDNYKKIVSYNVFEYQSRFSLVQGTLWQVEILITKRK